jgi:hypothetical protein
MGILTTPAGTPMPAISALTRSIPFVATARKRSGASGRGMRSAPGRAACCVRGGSLSGREGLNSGTGSVSIGDRRWDGLSIERTLDSLPPACGIHVVCKTNALLQVWISWLTARCCAARNRSGGF